MQNSALTASGRLETKCWYGQVAVIGDLGMPLIGRIDHPVLLHQDHVVAQQLAADREHGRMRGERDKRIVIHQRAARGQRIPDR